MHNFATNYSRDKKQSHSDFRNGALSFTSQCILKQIKDIDNSKLSFLTETEKEKLLSL
jgi:hypothetical protein